MATIPDAVREVLKGTAFWHLATLNEDGSATTTPVWADVDDGHVIVNTAIGRRKEKNARRDPRVALSVTNPENPYTWVEIRGRVVEFVEGDEADRSINALCKKYTGQDPYPWKAPGEQRVILRIAPDKVIQPAQ